jgi:ATP-dependent Lon protease
MSYPTGLISVLPLKNTVIYPGVSQALRVGRERSVKALNHAIANSNWIIAVSQKDPSKSVETAEDLYQIGTLAKVESSRGSAEGGFQIVVRGYQRVKIQRYEDNEFFLALPDNIDDQIDIDAPTQKALLGSLKELSKEVLALIPANTDQIAELVEGVDDLGYLSFLVAANADFDLSEKQKVLEIVTLRERTMHVLMLLQNFKENLKVQADIRQKLNSKFGQGHRQQILREQLKAIREELGEGQESSLIETYRAKIEKANMPPEALELALSQVKRLEDTNTASPEHQVLRNHLDLMIALPWSQSAQEVDIDLDRAREILNQDHYGLEKIKARILQHLAVLKLKKNQKGSILLFVGPPGVGKTSLGQSIAKALGKKYVRVSVGGIRDDAEIRGHRRTYVGALPGRIIAGIKKAGENNPVFVLDEIDKLSRSYTGDPASAMLEVLDPEQNNAFHDLYLDTGFDLSKVVFIATANSLDGIPGPLLDRMEVIDVNGYTTSEKFHIAKNYLIPKQLTEHGLTSDQLTLSDEALLKLISSFTREAGVRELQRKIAHVCRWSSEKVILKHQVRIDLKDLEEILGQERYVSEVTEAMSVPGVVTGLAWTPVGGDILFVETAMMPGTGQLLITGQLGDVMKESAQIAMSLLKTRMPFFGPALDFSKVDLHVHVPAGSIPKDGPSAGVTLLCSMASLLSRRSVDSRLAMTGEITLRGAVMPVGGIKEKVLAAHRAGVRKIILPKRNEKDLKEVPDEVKKEIEFFFAEHINEVLRIALEIELGVMEKDGFNIQPAQISPPVATND